MTGLRSVLRSRVRLPVRLTAGLGPALGAAALVLLGARVAYALAVRGVVVAWFPSGIMLGLLLVSERRRWPWLLLGGFAGNAVVDLATVGRVGFALAAPVANMAESVVAALFVRWRARGADLTRSLDGFLALLGALTLSNAATAALGATVLSATFGSPWERNWLVWWLGDGLGMLVVAPAALALVSAARSVGERRTGTRWSGPRWVEGGSLVGLIVLAVHAVFQRAPESPHSVTAALSIFPLLIWPALRMGPLIPTVATTALTVVSLWHTAAGRGPLVSPALSPLDQAIQVFAFLGVAASAVLVLSAVIAEKEDAADRVRDSESRYRAVVDAARDAIVTVDSRGRVVFCNAEVGRLLGVPPSALGGRAAFDVLPEGRRERAAEVFARYVDGGSSPPAQPLAVELVRRDGRVVSAEVVFGEWEEQGERRLTGIVRDVSERVKLEEHLRHIQKLEALGHLTAGVAHEFRNQLMVVQASLDVALLETAGTGPELVQSLGEIGAAVERSSAMVQDLLAFGRRQVLSPSELDLDDLVAHSVRSVQPLLNPAIRIEVDHGDDPKRVRADPSALQQSLLNLLLNARDAMPGGGLLTVATAATAPGASLRSRLSLSENGRFATLAVADTGAGIEPEVLSRIFEPFYTTKPEGTGLGLAAVYGTVRQSGGAIDVESAPGAGARFTIYLPCIDDA